MLQKIADPLVGAPFCGVPSVRPNMLNMPKSASGVSLSSWLRSRGQTMKDWVRIE